MMQTKQEKFLTLYEPIHNRFERFCRARVYGDLDYQDLMNETLLLAFEKLDTLKTDQAFLSFLFGIAVRILANKKKKKKEDAYTSKSNLLADNSADTALQTDVHFLHQALAQLNEDQRECIILFEISGFSIKEICDIQQASESAVKQRLKRGREKLQAILTYESSLKTGA